LDEARREEVILEKGVFTCKGNGSLRWSGRDTIKNKFGGNALLGTGGTRIRTRGALRRVRLKLGMKKRKNKARARGPVQ